MFIEQAYKGDNTPWKVVLTTLLSTGVFLLNIAVFFLMPTGQTDALYESLKNTPKLVSLVVNLFPFIFLLGLLWLLVNKLHERSILGLTTSRPKVDFGRIFFALGIVVFMTVIPFLVSYYANPEGIEWNFQPFKFATLVVLSLLLFPIQIAFEEYLFRGYLMQQIGIASASRFIPLVATSVIFGIFHGVNPEVHELGYGVMTFYIGTGFLLGIIALMDEGIELTLGYHLGNNLMAVLLVTSDYAAIQSDALFRMTEKTDPQSTLDEMFLSMAILYPLVLFIFAKKYKWTGWREKLFGKVKRPQTLIQNATYHEYDSQV